MKKIIALLLTVLMLTSLCACTSSETSVSPSTDATDVTKVETPAASENSTETTADPLYIAVAVPFTGDLAQYGTYILHGIETEVNRVNEAGGINGRMIEIDTFDDRGDANEAAAIAEKICSSGKYLCTFAGYTSGTAMASAPVYKKYQMVHIVPTASHTSITTAGDTSWAMNPSVMVEHDFVGRQATEDLGGKRIALVHLNADNGLQIAEAVSNGVTATGGEMVAIESYISGEVRDFSSIITKIKASDPDVIILTMQYADTSAFLIQAKQFGFDEDVKWLCNTDSFLGSFLEAAGDAAEGVYVEASWSNLADDEGIKTFRKTYNEMWDGEEPGSYSAQPYEAMRMVSAALADGVRTTAELQEWFTNMGEWQGQAFSGHFGEDQRFIRDKVYLSIVENGEFKPIY